MTLDGDENLRLLYEKAQDSAENNDAILWEVTAIIWSANVLLLGFAIEANGIAGEERVVVASVVGILLTWFAQKNYDTMRKSRIRKYEICQSLERNLTSHREWQVHCLEEQKYPRNYITNWHLTITCTFIVGWAANLVLAVCHILVRSVCLAVWFGICCGIRALFG